MKSKLRARLFYHEDSYIETRGQVMAGIRFSLDGLSSQRKKLIFERLGDLVDLINETDDGPVLAALNAYSDARDENEEILKGTRELECLTLERELNPHP